MTDAGFMGLSGFTETRASAAPVSEDQRNTFCRICARVIPAPARAVLRLALVLDARHSKTCDHEQRGKQKQCNDHAVSRSGDMHLTTRQARANSSSRARLTYSGMKYSVLPMGRTGCPAPGRAKNVREKPDRHYHFETQICPSAARPTFGCDSRARHAQQSRSAHPRLRANHIIELEQVQGRQCRAANRRAAGVRMHECGTPAAAGRRRARRRCRRALAILRHRQSNLPVSPFGRARA